MQFERRQPPRQRASVKITAVQAHCYSCRDLLSHEWWFDHKNTWFSWVWLCPTGRHCFGHFGGVLYSTDSCCPMTRINNKSLWPAQRSSIPTSHPFIAHAPSSYSFPLYALPTSPVVMRRRQRFEFDSTLVLWIREALVTSEPVLVDIYTMSDLRLPPWKHSCTHTASPSLHYYRRNDTARWQRHISVRREPRTRQRSGWDSNPWPVDCEYTAITTTPSRHTLLLYC